MKAETMEGGEFLLLGPYYVFIHSKYQMREVYSFISYARIHTSLEQDCLQSKCMTHIRFKNPRPAWRQTYS